MFKLFLQYIAPQHLLSRFLGFCAEHAIPFVTKPYIRYFVRHYQVNMQEAEYESLDHYKTFNQFFTRRLKAGLRPIEGDENILVSPADSTLSEFGKINQDKLIQAKGIDYRLNPLLAGKKILSDLFVDGDFATFYLSPKDYHRVHMPISGYLKAMYYVPGKLFSVSELTTEKIPGLFTKNERAIFIFDTAIGEVAVIMVGAIIVSSICTTWAGKLSFDKVKAFDLQQEKVSIARGEEMGHFELGSTVIVLTQKNKLHWKDGLQAGQAIKFGEMLGEKI